MATSTGFHPGRVIKYPYPAAGTIDPLEFDPPMKEESIGDKMREPRIQVTTMGGTTLDMSLTEARDLYKTLYDMFHYDMKKGNKDTSMQDLWRYTQGVPSVSYTAGSTTIGLLGLLGSPLSQNTSGH